MQGLRNLTQDGPVYCRLWYRRNRSSSRDTGGATKTFTLLLDDWPEERLIIEVDVHFVADVVVRGRLGSRDTGGATKTFTLLWDDWPGERLFMEVDVHFVAVVVVRGGLGTRLRVATSKST